MQSRRCSYGTQVIVFLATALGLILLSCGKSKPLSMSSPLGANVTGNSASPGDTASNGITANGQNPLVTAAAATGVGHLKFENAASVSDFGVVLIGTRAVRNFYLINDGRAPMGIALIQPVDPNSQQSNSLFSIQTPDTLPGDTSTPPCRLGTVLAPSGRCGFVVTFTPVSLPSGTASALFGSVIPIQYYGTGSGIGSWPVKGVATVAPSLSFENLTPTEFSNYYIQSNGIGACITVKNTHPTIGVTNVRLASVLQDPFAIDNSVSCDKPCLGTLDPEASCKLPVKFKPTAAGKYASNVSVFYNNGIKDVEATATISGTGALFTCNIKTPFQVFSSPASTTVWGTVSGSRTLSLPIDATNVSFILNDITESDFGVLVQLNGTNVVDRSGYPYRYHANWEVAYGVHNVAPAIKDLSGLIKKGDNAFFASTATYPWFGNTQQVLLNFAVGRFQTGSKAFADLSTANFDCRP